MGELTPQQWDDVQSIFERASGMPPARRDAFLDEACAGNGVLRAEVESLLAVDDDVEGFLETAAAPAMPGELPERVGPFRIVRPLGAGGMGEVFLAERADASFEQQVAIKLLRRGLGSGDFVRRFRVERQALANLEHPNIARLYDGGATDDGQPWLALEFVDGVHVDRHCVDHGLSVRERIELFVQVCDAVAHAHRALIVHRDLKPGNVLVDRDGVPKLLDFGVAKVLDTEGVHQTMAVTATGERLMTPRYASPEQVRGEAITTATDVYALGVILYELLTGVSPYGEATTSRHDLERAVVETRPLAPSDVMTADPRRSRQLRGDLDTIVLTALRKEPERRYSSAEALAADLRRVLRHEPIEARPDTWTYRTSRFLRRNRTASILAAGLVVALVVGLVVTTMLYRDSEQARADAQRAEGDARFDALIGNLAAARVELERFRAEPALARLNSVDESTRDWAWRYLAAQTDDSVERFDFDVGLAAVEVVEAGATLVVATTDQRIFFVDRATGGIEQEIELADGAREVPILCVSHDERTVVTACRSGLVSVIDVEARQVTVRADRLMDRIEDIALSPEGALLAVVGPSGMRVHRASDWTMLENVRFDGESLAVRFLPGGDAIAFTTSDAMTRIVEIPSGAVREVVPIRAHILEVTADGTLVAADPEGHLHIRRTDGEIVRARIAFGHIESMAVLPELGAIAVGSKDSGVHLADLASGRDLRSFAGHWQPARDFALDAEGRVLFSVANDRRLLGWDVSTLERVPTICESRVGLRRFALAPDASRVAIIEGEARVLLVDPDTTEQLAMLEHPDAVDVAYTGDGGALIVSDRMGRIQVYDPDTAALRRTLDRTAADGAEGGVMDVRTRGDGVTVLAVALGNEVHLVDGRDGTPITTCRGHAESVRDVALDVEAIRVASAARDGEVRVWDVQTGDCRHVLTGHRSAALAVAFRPGTNELVSGGFDRSIRVWDLDDGVERATLGQRGTVLAFAVDPEGARVAAGATTVDLGIWDVERGAEVLAIALRSFVYPRGFAFSADGVDLYGSLSVPLASGDWQDSLRRWSTRSGRERYDERRAILTAAGPAARLVDRLVSEHDSLDRVADAIRADATLTAPLCRAALNEVLRRAAPVD